MSAPPCRRGSSPVSSCSPPWGSPRWNGCSAPVPPPLGSGSLAFMVALLTRRPGCAAVAGLLAGLARPSGILLVVPAVVVWAAEEREWHWRLPSSIRARHAVVTAAPVAGTGLYLLWCHVVMG